MFKVLLLAVSITLLLVVVVMWNSSRTVDDPEGIQQYHASDEIIEPYEVSKNPYRLKGHSGILDTTRVSMLMPSGDRIPTPYPGGGLRFEKMIDENTATYEVLVGGEEVMPDGEIAVVLPDSNPPDSRRPWRVYVEEPKEAVNGLGTRIKVSTVRFEGYYTSPPKPAEVSPIPTQSNTAVATEQTTVTRSESAVHWTAMSHTAEAITGDIDFFADSITILKNNYPLNLIRELHGEELEDAAQLFSTKAMPDTRGLFLRMQTPKELSLLNGNTFCDKENPAWMIAVVTHGSGSQAGTVIDIDVLNLAFFTGDVEPRLQSQALSASATLCGTFTYESKVLHSASANAQ
jgi:hypothetical protein